MSREDDDQKRCSDWVLPGLIPAVGLLAHLISNIAAKDCIKNYINDSSGTIDSEDAIRCVDISQSESLQAAIVVSILAAVTSFAISSMTKGGDSNDRGSQVDRNRCDPGNSPRDAQANTEQNGTTVQVSLI